MKKLFRKLKSLKPYIRQLSLTKKLLSLTLLAAMAATAVIVPQIGVTYAGLSSSLTGPNDSSMNDFMNANSPTTTAGWIGYLNTQWHNTCQPKFQWFDTSDLVAAGTCSRPATGHYSSTPDRYLVYWASTANGGSSTAPSQVGNEMMIPYLSGSTWQIWSGEQLGYAVVNAANNQTIQLERDIDLNGYNYSFDNAATTVKSGLTLDGNGHTIYNLGYYRKTNSANGVLLPGLNASTVKNLTLVSAKMVDASTGGTGFSLLGALNTPASPSAASQMCTLTNVVVKNSLIYCNKDAGGNGGQTAFLFQDASTDISTGATTSNKGKPAYLHLITRCSVIDSYSYGYNHISSLAAFTSGCDFSNCNSSNTIVVSTGAHSGGFVSCYDGYMQAENCFTNATVYGTTDTGVFFGAIDGGGVFKNCYTSGYIEGMSSLGGFFGKCASGYWVPSVIANYGQYQFINCYSTSMVGMQNGGLMLGGFGGQLYDGGSSTRPGYLFQNCYAAGEVGSADTDVTASAHSANSPTVGGFIGANTTTAPLTYTSDYYDKQTTAMREWATGASQIVTGITGALTTDTVKSGTGLTSAPGSVGFKGFASGNGANGNNDWVYASGLYPQLAVFANANAATWGDQTTADLVKACSQASASTIFCDTYNTGYNGNTLPATTYDTVRDLTQEIPMTANSATVWSKGNTFIGAPADPTAVLYGKTFLVMNLVQSGSQYKAVDYAPGIQWLTVQVKVNGQVGTRALRLIPTANLFAGVSQVISAETTYNHAADVRMAYSTAPRVAANLTDITQGVFPDNPLSTTPAGTCQQDVQGSIASLPSTYQSAFLAADNQYKAVNVGHMDLNKTHAAQIPSNATYTSAGASGPGGTMYVTGIKNGADIGLDNTNNAIDNAFNGVIPFTASNDGTYTLTYDWVLDDGRFLTANKNIEVMCADKNAYINGSTTAQNGEKGNPVAVNPGEVIHYKLTVNNALSPALIPPQGTVVNDTVPAGLMVDTGSISTGGTYDAASRKITWNLTDQPEGVTELTFDAAVSDPGYYENTAYISYYDGATELTNTTYHCYLPAPQKDAYINGSTTAQNGTEDNYQPVNSGDTIQYKLTFYNPLPPTIANPVFHPQSLTPPTPINFVNGSFETPAVTGRGQIFDSSLVPGWNNTAENAIEIQVAGGDSSSLGMTYARNAPDGNQYAELNANLEGTLYQVVDTVPGTKVYWEFYHGARGVLGAPTVNTDVMNFFLSPPDLTGATLTGVGSPYFQVQASDSWVQGDPYLWGHYTGSYIVPAGQTQTQFSFQSVSTTSGRMNYGNYLDGIRFYTSSYIELTKSDDAPNGQAKIGDTVTYTIAAKNAGEADASNVVINDTLPAGTALVPGTVKIDGSTTNNYSYDDATGALSVNVGAGATAANGGLMKGTSSFSADCNASYTVTFQIKVTGDKIAENLKFENQAQAAFQDRYDETNTQMTNYSNVDEFGFIQQSTAATLTDVLPDGLTYVSHTDVNGSTFNISGQTCTWNWSALPYGKTVVTVTVKVDPKQGETDFVNRAKVTINGVSTYTNYTYHKLQSVILHIRQVLLPVDGQTSLPPNLSLPQMGYMTLTGFNKANPGTILGASLNITTISEKDVTPQHFSDYKLNPAKTGNQYDVTGIVPQYFHYVGYDVTYSAADLPHLAGDMNTDPEILVDYSSHNEAWVTVYFRPNTDNPKDNNVDQATNQFGTINVP